jgi:hypothetical protein
VSAHDPCPIAALDVEPFRNEPGEGFANGSSSASRARLAINATSDGMASRASAWLEVSSNASTNPGSAKAAR